MEGELWWQIYRLLQEESNKRHRTKRLQFSDSLILCVYAWAVLHDRPISWACKRKNWSDDLHWLDLPSESTMSVRLRTLSVRALLQSLLDRLRHLGHPTLARVLDSKPLEVGCYSKDSDARWGMSTIHKARGYKIFCAWGGGIVPDVWTMGPMNAADSEKALELVPQLTGAVYVLGDAGYDSNPLHRVCSECGIQLVAPRRKPKSGLGHCHHEPTRLRSLELLEWPVDRGKNPSPFGQQLYAMRKQIERDYGNLCSFGGGYQSLPSFVRRPHRVAMWVAAKLLINGLRICKNAGLAA